MFLKLPQENDSVEKLWKNEKTVYRYWIFGTIAAIVFLIILSFLQLLFSHVLFKEQVNNVMQTIADRNEAKEKEAYAQGIFNLSSVFIPGIFFIGAIVSLCFYIQSVVKSYKVKDFQYLSRNFRVFFTTFSFLIILSFLFFGFNENNVIVNTMKSVYFIPFTMLYIATPITAFLLGEINLIRQIFATVTIRRDMNNFLEKIKNGDIASAIQTAPTGEKMQVAEVTESDAVKEIEHDKNNVRATLESLPNAKLYAIAEKLNIFGYKDMSHEELISKIIENIKK
ncbi:Uncharacterised protein [Mycoplasmopsis californica]|uniref:Rho termination factor N-terminal domain-containing protein n=1 Tax=Mycoplasmopsis equigenitalium TaxID=114883 RepID=A0ABY5J392_9BACT|nr:hypothetical protein [Mycoplasmopsis equigenitalium]UUD37248.1 Rho termination factor N-terminal domain-containing protein [Mycoplasmopsis equigenitalium]VEU69444.1 Uncharacterised protein [Mycoplasmopsis californica]